jgi:predicted molibdopterin-dependent oxidoreductase YjgC
VLIDTHRSELSERAHVALPARTHAEYEGSFTNWKNRAQRFAPVLEPAFEAWPMGAVLAQIAAAAGLSGWDAPYEPRAASRELAAAVPAFAEASLQQLGALGVELAK